MAGRDSLAFAAASYAWGYRDVGEKSEIGLVVVQTLALSSHVLWSFADQFHRLISALSAKISVAPSMEKGVKPAFFLTPDLDAGAYVRSVKSRKKGYELGCSS